MGCGTAALTGWLCISPQQPSRSKVPGRACEPLGASEARPRKRRGWRKRGAGARWHTRASRCVPNCCPAQKAKKLLSPGSPPNDAPPAHPSTPRPRQRRRSPGQGHSSCPAAAAAVAAAPAASRPALLRACAYAPQTDPASPGPRRRGRAPLPPRPRRRSPVLPPQSLPPSHAVPAARPPSTTSTPAAASSQAGVGHAHSLSPQSCCPIPACFSSASQAGKRPPACMQVRVPASMAPVLPIFRCCALLRTCTRAYAGRWSPWSKASCQTMGPLPAVAAKCTSCPGEGEEWGFTSGTSNGAPQRPANPRGPGRAHIRPHPAAPQLPGCERQHAATMGDCGSGVRPRGSPHLLHPVALQLCIV